MEGKKLIFIQFNTIQCQHFHLHACSRALQHIWTLPSKYISGCCAKSYTSQTYVNIQRDHTEVVEAPWGQPLREVGGKQETGEEGEEEVVTVTGQGVALAAAAPAAEEDLDTEKQPGFKNKDNTKTLETHRVIFVLILQKQQRDEKNADADTRT